MLTYYMPTKVIECENVVKENKELFTEFGKKALIVTGRNSSKINGALDDVTGVLNDLGIGYEIFDRVVENPPVDNVVEGAEAGAGCDFIIGIGGGSPIDAAKAVGVLMVNGTEDAYNKLMVSKGLKSVPIIAIPTTAGTGTETTPYAILTDHKLKTKRNYSARVFPVYALMDVKYFAFMPKHIRNNTCIDALTHLIESYMTVNATPYCEYIALEGIRMWGTVKETLKDDVMSTEAMAVFMRASTLAGMAISQTGTSLPHGMGYPLTYYNGIAHGMANGLVMKAYLEMCKDTKKVENIHKGLGFDSLKAFGVFIQELIGTLDITEDEIKQYSDDMAANTAKLKNHPDVVTAEDIQLIYKKSVEGVI